MIRCMTNTNDRYAFPDKLHITHLKVASYHVFVQKLCHKCYVFCRSTTTWMLHASTTSSTQKKTVMFQRIHHESIKLNGTAAPRVPSQTSKRSNPKQGDLMQGKCQACQQNVRSNKLHSCW